MLLLMNAEPTLPTEHPLLSYKYQGKTYQLLHVCQYLTTSLFPEIVLTDTLYKQLK